MENEHIGGGGGVAVATLSPPPSESDTVHLILRCIDGRRETVDVPRNVRIQDLADLVGEHFGYSSSRVRMICRGRALAVRDRLNSYIPNDEASPTIHVVFRPQSSVTSTTDTTHYTTHATTPSSDVGASPLRPHFVLGPLQLEDLLALPTHLPGVLSTTEATSPPAPSSSADSENHGGTSNNLLNGLLSSFLRLAARPSATTGATQVLRFPSLSGYEPSSIDRFMTPSTSSDLPIIHTNEPHVSTNDEATPHVFVRCTNVLENRGITVTQEQSSRPCNCGHQNSCPEDCTCSCQRQSGASVSSADDSTSISSTQTSESQSQHHPNASSNSLLNPDMMAHSNNNRRFSDLLHQRIPFMRPIAAIVTPATTTLFQRERSNQNNNSALGAYLINSLLNRSATPQVFHISSAMTASSPQQQPLNLQNQAASLPNQEAELTSMMSSSHEINSRSQRRLSDALIFSPRIRPPPSSSTNRENNNTGSTLRIATGSNQNSNIINSGGYSRHQNELLHTTNGLPKFLDDIKEHIGSALKTLVNAESSVKRTLNTYHTLNHQETSLNDTETAGPSSLNQESVTTENDHHLQVNRELQRSAFLRPRSSNISSSRITASHTNNSNGSVWISNAHINERLPWEALEHMAEILQIATGWSLPHITSLYTTTDENRLSHHNNSPPPLSTFILLFQQLQQAMSTLLSQIQAWQNGSGQLAVSDMGHAVTLMALSSSIHAELSALCSWIFTHLALHIDPSLLETRMCWNDVNGKRLSEVRAAAVTPIKKEQQSLVNNMAVNESCHSKESLCDKLYDDCQTLEQQYEEIGHNSSSGSNIKRSCDNSIPIDHTIRTKKPKIGCNTDVDSEILLEEKKSLNCNVVQEETDTTTATTRESSVTEFDKEPSQFKQLWPAASSVTVPGNSGTEPTTTTSMCS